MTATSIGCTASRPSPSIIVSATATIVSKLRSDRKRGLKRSRSARRRSATSSANSATSAAAAMRRAEAAGDDRAHDPADAPRSPSSSKPRNEAPAFWRMPEPPSASSRPAIAVAREQQPAGRAACAERPVEDPGDDRERPEQRARDDQHVVEQLLDDVQPVDLHWTVHAASLLPARSERAHRARPAGAAWARAGTRWRP